jgi:hypothetical protein
MSHYRITIAFDDQFPDTLEQRYHFRQWAQNECRSDFDVTFSRNDHNGVVSAMIDYFKGDADETASRLSKLDRVRSVGVVHVAETECGVWRKGKRDGGAADFLIWSNEHRAWWAPHCRGYTTVTAMAGRYSEAEADRIVQDANVTGVINEVKCAAPSRDLVVMQHLGRNYGQG